MTWLYYASSGFSWAVLLLWGHILTCSCFIWPIRHLVSNLLNIIFFLLLLFATLFIILIFSFYLAYAFNYMCRGPTFGMRGKVELIFEENPLSKVGVKFDKPITDGVDLGGLCEPGHGFFCNGNIWFCCQHQLLSLFILFFIFLYYSIKLRVCVCAVTDLRVDSSGTEDWDKLYINTLFEVVLLYQKKWVCISMHLCFTSHV